jgi:hypothetical protein
MSSKLSLPLIASVAASSAFAFSGMAIAAMSTKLACGSLGIVSVYQPGSATIGKAKGVVNAPSLGLTNYPITMNIGGNWWAAEGYEITVFAGADGYFAKTKNAANGEFFDGREVVCRRA